MATREERKLVAKRLELDQLDLELQNNPSEDKKLEIEILEIEIQILEIEIQILDPDCLLNKDNLVVLLTEKEKRLNHLLSNSTPGIAHHFNDSTSALQTSIPALETPLITLIESL